MESHNLLLEDVWDVLIGAIQEGTPRDGDPKRNAGAYEFVFRKSDGRKITIRLLDESVEDLEQRLENGGYEQALVCVEAYVCKFVQDCAVDSCIIRPEALSC